MRDGAHAISGAASARRRDSAIRGLRYARQHTQDGVEEQPSAAIYEIGVVEVDMRDRGEPSPTGKRSREVARASAWSGSPPACGPTEAEFAPAPEARPTPRSGRDTWDATRAACSRRSRARRTLRPRRCPCTTRRRRRGSARDRSHAAAAPPPARARRESLRSAARGQEPSSACGGRAGRARRPRALARATRPRLRRRPDLLGASERRWGIRRVVVPALRRTGPRSRPREVVRRGRRRPRTVSASCAASAD